MSKLARLFNPEHPPLSGDPQSLAALEAVRGLIRAMSPEDRERILVELTEIVRPIPAPRAGDVLSAIIKFLPRRQSWTVSDIKSEIGVEGVNASAKEVYNAVGYLTRRKHITRVGYGRYIVDGNLIVTSDDLGGERDRHEDLSDDGRLSLSSTEAKDV